MYFSRADVESLPFKENTFDGCFVCGSLHLFPDTYKALIEISHMLKPGALTSIQKFARSGMTKYEFVSRLIFKQDARVFDIPILQKIMDDAGFERLEQRVKGSSLWITARKL